MDLIKLHFQSASIPISRVFMFYVRLFEANKNILIKRYLLTGFKNVTVTTVSYILMILSKSMFKKTKKPEVVILLPFGCRIFRSSRPMLNMWKPSLGRATGACSR